MTPEGLFRYVEERAGRIAALASDLVRIPSENMPPDGSENGCQEYIAASLRRLGWSPSVYDLADVPGLREHPLYWSGRNYEGRRNLGARLRGAGGGRSLVLSGHIDTVPAGTQPWTRDPFGGQIEGGRVYGRGSNDMKGGVAINIFVAEAIADLGLRLRGDLVFETVVDEEFGGCNGTLAGRLAGYNGDAAVLSEPSFLRICPAQRGGRTAHIRFHGFGGVLSEGRLPVGVVDQVRHFLVRLEKFASQRRAKAPVHYFYRDHVDPVPVSITKIFTGPWGTREPITLPEECRIEMYWQTMPGESQEDVEREFHEWFGETTAMAPEIFQRKPEVHFPIRWLPGSAIAESEPVIGELSSCAEAALGRPPVVAGIEGPCDLYIFQQHFRIPAVLWGPRGGNTHAADEYLEIESAVQAAKALLLFVLRWCGVEGADGHH
jgi:acetylornithine deacetylase